MEDMYWNLSNSSNTTTEVSLGPGFTAFIIVLALVLGAIITFVGLMAIILLLSTSLPIPVRGLLINLLIASLFSAVMSFSSLLNTLALSLSDAANSSLPFCRFVLWGITVSLEARLLSLVAFSVTVRQMVTGGVKLLGTKWLIYCLAAIWVIAIITRVDTIIPPIYGVQYVGGVACFPSGGYAKYRVLSLAYSASWIVIGCFLPVLVCIFIPLATLCYIKRHTITEGAQYKKAMAKFAAFLIIGNIINVLGQVVPAIVTLSVSDVVGVCLSYMLYLVSLIPTPILIIVFLKPVRKQMARLLCKVRLKNKVTAQQMNM